MKRILLIVGIAVVLALAAMIVYYDRTPVSENKTPELKIGAVLPLTGPAAANTDYIKKGLDLAAEEVNARGAIRMSIKYEDSKNSPTEGVSVFNRLVMMDKPPVIVSALSSVTKAIAPMAEPNKTVIIGTAVSLPGVTSPSSYVFRVYPEANGVAGVIARFAREKYKSAVVIYINDDFGISGAEVFRKDFEENGGKVLLREPYEMAQMDFRTQWGKIKKLNPECVWIIGYGPAYSMIIRQWKELGVKSTLLGDMTMGIPATLASVGGSSEGVVYVDGKMDAAFASRFKSRYQIDATSYSGYAYDLIMMAAKVAQEKDTTPGMIKDGLAGIKGYNGVMGSITFLPNRDASLEFCLMQIKNGKPTLYSAE